MKKELPIFIVENNNQREVLTKPASYVNFPLAQEDKDLIQRMKYMVKESLGDCAGLAASQVGFAKRIIVYHVQAEWREWRHDLESEVPLTVLINPSYEPLAEAGKALDWERCFSVRDFRGKVYRHNLIHYRGYDEMGNLVEGIARGFLARLLQHEIDHTNGKLILDCYDPKSPHGTPEDVRKIVEKEIISSSNS